MDNTVAIIACLKTEELYIREWLDYHISIGVDHFYLCDNNDSDYPIKLIDIVHDYIDKGLVDIFNYNDVHPIQPICYTEIYYNFGDDYDWYLIIDVDEFLTIPITNNDLKKFIESFPDYIDNIAFNWRFYGDNGLIEYDGRGCLERFTQPENIVKNDHHKILNGKSNKIKTMCRNKQYYLDNYPYFNPIIYHQHYGFDRKQINTYNKHNEIKLIKYDVLFDPIKWQTEYHPLTIENLFNQDDPIYDKRFQDIYNICYLKHFYSKTIDEFIKYKINRGDTIKDFNHEKYPYSLGKFFGHNYCTEAHKKFLLEKYGIKR